VEADLLISLHDTVIAIGCLQSTLLFLVNKQPLALPPMTISHHALHGPCSFLEMRLAGWLAG